MFIVCMCSTYHTSPKESHFKFVKRILRYHNETSHHGLWYPKGRACILVSLYDSDFARCKLDRKRIRGTYHLFGSFFVSWNSKKKHSDALSTVEDEYIVVGSCCA